MLNRRPLISDKWMTHHRNTVIGSMRSIVRAWVPHSEGSGWNPLGGQPDYEEGQTADDVRYLGAARVQPNLAWRARAIEAPGQIPIQHAFLIQVDQMGNRHTPGSDQWATSPYAIGDTPVGTLIQVVNVVKIDGVKVSKVIGKLTYVVRNISESSNAWVRSLLCDVDVNDMTAVHDGS